VEIVGNRGQEQVRRGGFFTPVVILFALLAMIAAGYALERMTARFRSAASSAGSSSVAAAAFLGIKHAEDWLISSVLSEGFPTSGANYGDPDPMRLIEAVRGDGSSVGDSPPGALTPTPSLYVADADYPGGLFAAPAKGEAGPFIPRMPRIDSGTVECRFYYLRSEASDDIVISVNEELLVVSADAASGVVEVGRLFFRSCPQ
jgi:hypothetical protein